MPNAQYQLSSTCSPVQHLYRDVNTKEEMKSPNSYSEAIFTSSGFSEPDETNIEAPGSGDQQQRPAAPAPAPAISFAAEKVQAVCRSCNKQVGIHDLSKHRMRRQCR